MAAAAVPDDATGVSTQSQPWLRAYHGCGEGPPVSMYAGYACPFKVEDLKHGGTYGRGARQHEMSVDACGVCKQLCFELR